MVERDVVLAAHVVATEAYGLPADLTDTFTLLEKNGVLEAPLANRSRKMVGFRNLALHQHEVLDPKILEAIVTERLDDFRQLAARITTHFSLAPGARGRSTKTLSPAPQRS